MASEEAAHDVIVVGGGPAGLTAAIYLGRFRRHCVVLEDGLPRARWIPTSHNIPGFTAGIGGADLLDRLRAQALKYGADIRRARVIGIQKTDGVFALVTDQGTLRSRYVLLATGVKDHLPALGGVQPAIEGSILRLCPICDAYEAIDQRIAVIGDGALGEREARFLSHYSPHVTLLHLGPMDTREFAGAMPALERLAVELAELRIENGRVILRRPGEDEREFDVAYLALGCSAQNHLALALGAVCDEHGALQVSLHQETSVPGLYAAGDVVRGLNQVVLAAAESAVAATDIHNKLRSARHKGFCTA